ncbi:MAG TPA: AraC family transcriptional regulator [Cyclobacteriaceae bacterium]
MPIIREIIFGAARRGASVKELLRLSGLEESQLKNPELNVPFEQAQDVWRYAVTLTDDALLGLHIGEDTTPSIVGLTGHLMQASPDLKTAFQQVCSFNQVFTDMFHYHLTEGKKEIILEYKPATLWKKLYPESASQAVDQAMSGTLNVFKLLSGKEIVPLKIELGERQRKYQSEYERVFGTTVKYASENNRLYYTADQLSLPVLSYDKKLFTIFNNLLALQKRELKGKNPVTQEVKQLLQEVYQFKAPTLEAMASQLNLVPRTLQRKLEEEGTSYRALVLSMRNELSKKLLKVSDSKVKTIAGMLGYSDVSSFRRAFKKWTNKSPKAFKG